MLGADLATTAAARSLFGPGVPVIGWEDGAVDGNPRLGPDARGLPEGAEEVEGVPAGTHTGALGIAGGFADAAAAAEILDADVVLAVGTSLTPFTMRFGEGFAQDATLVQVTTDSSQFHPRSDVTVEADAGEFARALLAGLRSEPGEDVGPVSAVNGQRSPGSQSKHGGPDESSSDVYAEAPGENAGGMVESSSDGYAEAPGERGDPEEIAHALGQVLPSEITVVSDGGHFIGWPTLHWTVLDPSAFMQLGTAYKCIGLGTGGAVGAATARPERTTILVSGDGGLQMALADLVTFAGVPGRKIVVVFNDAGYGAEFHQFGWRGLSLTMAELGDRNFASLGPALGGEGITLRSPAGAAEVAAWLEEHDPASDAFLVIDCKVSRRIAPFFQEIVDRAKR